MEASKALAGTGIMERYETFDGQIEYREVTEVDPTWTESKPDWAKPCERCGREISRWRGMSEVSCGNCGAEYNAFGQRLRDDWAGNRSNWDDDVSDLDGYEMQHAGDE